MFPNGNNFESEFTFENAAVSLPEEPPFNVLLLGSWSGNVSRNDLNERQPIVIDRDNFDDILKRLNVTIDLDFQGAENNVLHLRFEELDDFHPDNLFRNVSVFTELRDVRRRLSNSDTFENAAREVRSWFKFNDESLVSDAEIQTQIEDAPPIDSNNLLDMILTQPTDSTASLRQQPVDSTELGRFVANIVSPYLIKIDENEQSNLIAAVDETISEIMRTILHHPNFQALESAWRGLYFLVRRLETGTDLKLYILDISQDELTENLRNVNDLTESFLYQKLVKESFAAIGGNYTFGINIDDIALLMRVGKLASAANAPFISYIKPEMLGISNFSRLSENSRISFLENSKEGKLWDALRASPEANYIGLSPMKILIRMPYGEASDSTETFSFEEFNEKNDPTKHTWVNPCFAILLLLAKSYSLYGWEIEQNLALEIENLPLYVFREDDETKTMPCAEIVLTENILEYLLMQGLMPLVSFRNSNKVRLARLQSVSFSKRDLYGGWNF
jgi:type VI secretion system protein ImpC